MRGTGHKTGGIAKAGRITPACAGNRDQEREEIPMPEDHPRVCGEQLSCTHLGSASIGSPPRVRGTGQGGAGDCRVARITPACAGNSPWRAWADAGHRITPACAGNRDGELSWTNDGEDHPRVCGEQAPHAPQYRSLHGSPPRVRGTDTASWATRPQTRITPACAGNRLFWPALTHPEEYHPRVCGEQATRPACAYV